MPEVLGNKDPLAGPSRPSSACSGATPSATKKRKPLEEDLLHNAVGAMKEITTALQTNKNISFVPTAKQNEDIFGEFVASKLKLIKNIDEKNKAEAEICNILYSALRK